mmetsp:Transcript_22564/g.49434  ORF Transcript_22564/g.49434 Transcript_22564/m.49434 type:complete len:790 (-) Transcript_22564:447-2816(-)
MSLSHAARPIRLARGESNSVCPSKLAQRVLSVNSRKLRACVSRRRLKHKTITRAAVADTRAYPSGAGDDSALPFDSNYDADKLNSYYSKRRLNLANRVGFCAARVLRVATAWTLDEYFPSTQGERRGKVLRDAIAGMGPVFVKLGQTLSTRPDLLGDEACEALGTLQDQMPPFNDKVAFNTIAEELNWKGPICPEDDRPGLEGTATLFKELTMTPVSAASLGQVYRGMTHEGVEVAVKVQRPALLPAVSRDLYILRAFLNWWEKSFQSGAITPDIADSLGEGIFAELDYRREAANMDAFREAHAALPFMAVPQWLPRYTSKRVLTTEWVRGRKLSQLPPADQVRAAQYGVESSVAQLLMTGVLHADPHEGNLLFGDDGRLHFLDFGLLSIMERRHMEGMATGILTLMSGDWPGLLRAFGDMQVLNPPFLKWDYESKKGKWLPIERREFEAAFISCLANAGSQAERTSFGELFVELGTMANDYRFTCPPYYILVMRSFVTLEGVAARADPDFNIYTAAAPYAVRRALTPRTPSGITALRRALLNDRGELRLEELQAAMAAAHEPSPVEGGGGPELVQCHVTDHGHARPGQPMRSRNTIDEGVEASTSERSAPQSSTTDQVLGTVREVLASRDGRALRRILLSADSLALARSPLLCSPPARAALSAAIANALPAAPSAAPSATPPSPGELKAAVQHHFEASQYLQRRMAKVLAMHHMRQAAATMEGKRVLAGHLLFAAVVCARVLATRAAEVAAVPLMWLWQAVTWPVRALRELLARTRVAVKPPPQVAFA